MAIGVNNFEEEMASINAMLKRLIKESQEREACIKLQEEKIARLTRKLERRPVQSLAKSSESEGEERVSIQSEASDEEIHSKKVGKLKNGGSSSLLIVKQIQDLIAIAVKVQLGGGMCKTHLYTKPYTKRVDALCMPRGYQPPKFQQFDVNGNPKQHVTHFIESCNNASSDGDLMIKQFVWTLKGVAFDCYTYLEQESIDSWG